jgi:adenosylhomocysteine nucleosidase
VTRVGVITGLARETDCLNTFEACLRPPVVCAGASPVRAAEAARFLVSEGCTGLVSFGIAGGLDPALGSGTLIVPTEVIAQDGGRFFSDPSWRGRILSAVGSEFGPIGESLVGADTPVLGVEQKRALYAQTAAAAVDMESLAVAAIATETKTPFLVVRAIADPANRSIPRWVTDLVEPQTGRPRIGAAAVGILTHFRDVPKLIRLAGDSETGLRTLRRVAAIAGPVFQFAA